MACYSLKPINNFWKLDKIDKIGISLILLFFTIFSITTCFASSSEVVGQTFNGVSYDFTNDVFQTVPTAKGLLFNIERGYRYTLTIDGTGYYNLYFSTGKPVVGESCNFYIPLPEYSRKYSFDFTTSDYMLAVTFSGNPSDVVLIREPVGMYGSLSLLSSLVGVSSIWSVFELAVPYIFVVVLISIGIYFIFHAIREMSKGRDI